MMVDIILAYARPVTAIFTSYQIRTGRSTGRQYATVDANFAGEICCLSFVPRAQKISTWSIGIQERHPPRHPLATAPSLALDHSIQCA
jgi:hypothetical protein